MTLHDASQRRTLCSLSIATMRSPLFVVALAISYFPSNVQASPVSIVVKRAEGSLSPSIWIPILAVATGLVLLVGLCYYRKSWRKYFSAGISSMSFGTGVVSPPIAASTTEVREITAEQLAGTVRGTTTTPANPPPARRTRRPRRTPSQISTVSLPAYNKEPGDEEVVIFRGPEDMEDAPITGLTTTVEMPAEDDSSQDLRLTVSNTTYDSTSTDSDPAARRNSQYGEVPETPHDQPLLHNDDEHLSQPPGEGMPVRNVTSASPPPANAVSTSTAHPDPRGPAPAYFEVAVVDLSRDDDLETGTPDSRSRSVSDATHPEMPGEETARRSAFRNIFGGVFGNARSNYRSPYAHGRAGSNASTSTTGTRHRPSHSLALSQSQSRSSVHSSSNHNHALTSPSMISLNSISAPLTHTVVRTEFTYPRSGPTPDQIKLISSRESFARFGLPYGEDAVRFASQSRLGVNDDDTLPPEFDEPNGSASRIRPRSGSMGHTRGASSTSLAVADGQVNDATTPASPLSATVAIHRRGSSTSVLPIDLGSHLDLGSAAPSSSARSATFSSRASQPAQQLARASSVGALVKPSPGRSIEPSSSGLPAGAAPPEIRALSRASSVSAFSYATAAESFRTATAGSRSVTPGGIPVGEFGGPEFQPYWTAAEEEKKNGSTAGR